MSCGIGIHINEVFMVFVYQIHWSVFILDDVLPLLYVLISWIGHLESIHSLNFTYIPNVDTFLLHSSKKIYILVSPLISSEKCLGVENLAVTYISFPNSSFCLNAKNLSLIINISVVLLEGIGLLCLVLRKCLPNTQVWTIISLIL